MRSLRPVVSSSLVSLNVACHRLCKLAGGLFPGIVDRTQQATSAISAIEIVLALPPLIGCRSINRSVAAPRNNCSLRRYPVAVTSLPTHCLPRGHRTKVHLSPRSICTTRYIPAPRLIADHKRFPATAIRKEFGSKQVARSVHCRQIEVFRYDRELLGQKIHTKPLSLSSMR